MSPTRGNVSRFWQGTTGAVDQLGHRRMPVFVIAGFSRLSMPAKAGYYEQMPGGCLMKPPAAALLALLLPVAAVADDWPHWRGPSRTGVSAETDWLDTWPKDGP